MATTEHDVVVVGAGPNGLVAANLLADKGLDVVVLEAQPEVGGAVRSARDVHPDYVHDTFSSFYPLAAASGVMGGLGLEHHGLVWSHAPAVLGHPLPDGSWAMLHRDVDRTAASMEALGAGDGDRWRTWVEDWGRIGGPLVDALTTPFPPIRAGARVLAALPGVGGMDYVRRLLEPASVLGRDGFGGPGPALLFAGNAGHADIPTDATGSGLMGLLMTMLGQTVGFPVPRGGAGELAAALTRRFTALGGEVRCSARVDRVLLRDGRAVGVRVEGGETVQARRAVVADVVAPVLYGDLIPDDELPARLRRRMRSFELDPGTVKVDWALDGPVPWASAPETAPGTIHLADSVTAITEATSQITSHAVPAEPLLIVGQMTTADATRSPAGTEALWAYAHVPQDVRHDAGDGGITGRWDRDDLERFADRMQRRLEAYAPDLASRVVARRVLGPRELEERDANLVGGAINGGTSAIHQQLVFRPVPGNGRATTPVPGLFLASASAHPGGGVHGAPGANAARAVLAEPALLRRTRPLVARLRGTRTHRRTPRSPR
ncbi:NAD(P)/FAD-dependent oxidoreductase [Mumia zhuanghuii]|uniref:Pyridine nucleotide-disulfide oxidoreductase domain-containing protein 2 n=2 Tax=Mumia TaxID=1546255 RepID=A0ABW1QG46_9ACTN|nr:MULTISPECIES: NAD(P)/FAD-dependent oxidoreductase [Mumia]KAA1424694.1 NAD(P)/FAD-dependent oxidoreductase [Mumia zhuanghuii]